MSEIGAAPGLVTAEELLVMPDRACFLELVDGVVHEYGFGGAINGFISANVLMAVTEWDPDDRLGVWRGCRVGIILRRNPDTVLAPMMSFWQASRRWPPTQGYIEVVPDIVMVQSYFNSSVPRLLRNIGIYLEAGVRELWMLWVDEQVARIWRGRADVTTVGMDGVLRHEALLPGFALPLREVFGDDDG